MDILHLLLKSSGEPVSKRALREFVWPDTFVHEGNLKVHIHSLRRALGETSPQPTYIATVAGRGYRFIPPVSSERVTSTTVSREVVPLVHSLPAQRALIGRQSDIKRLAGLLAEKNLVTLVGPGGVGKTTIAVTVAHRLQETFPDGIYFVDLSITNDLSSVPDILAAVCGIRGHPPDIVAAVVRHLGNRRVLVLIDSCEHVLAAVALIATRFQEAGIAARVLATSLEPLRLSNEAVQLIEPLDYPSTAAMRALPEALRYSSIALFATRALEWADYPLTDSDVPAVATLCQKLGGLPLAIELAATQLGQYSPATLLESLDRRFSLLRNEDPDAHRRHRTLWATLDWSYQLLSAGEATIFRLVSLFSGTFTHEDVAAMAQVVGFNAYQTTVALGGLVAKSLVAAEVDEDTLRYRLLDWARVYAAERLSEDPLAHEAQRHFAHFMVSTLERFAQERGSSFLAEPDRALYKWKLNDLRDTLSWCFNAGNDPALGIRLTVLAIPLWDEFSLIAEQQAQVDRALKHSASPACSADQLALLAVSRAWSLAHRRLRAAGDAWALAVQFAERGNDVNQRLRALWGQAAYLIIAGRYREASGCLEDYHQIALQHENGVAVPDGERLSTMAMVCLGKLTAARSKLERLWRELRRGVPSSGVPRYQVEPYTVIRWGELLVTWLMGYPDRATALANETVDYIGHAGHTQAHSHVLGTAAIPIALWNSDLESLERYTAQLGANLAEDVDVWRPGHRFFSALILHARGERSAVDEMRSAIDEIQATDFLMHVPLYLGLLADALLKNGALAEAERTVEEALNVQARTEEAYSLPDLLRIRAKVWVSRGRREAAERPLLDAMAKATEMNARSLQLRVGCDLADLWIAAGRGAEAAALLGPVYDAFSEGYETHDVLRAAALLEATKDFARRA